MFYDHHFIGMHWIGWILLAGLILLMIYIYTSSRSGADLRQDALEILKNRFARGEIEREEYEERKRVLEES